MNEREKNTWQERYSFCRNVEERSDLIFVYPPEFGNVAKPIADKLQEAMDFLKNITELNPTKFFDQRTVIGYRHPNNEGGNDCSPGWKPNWVNIPWKYLKKANEPLDSCSHELVHPFFRCSPLHDRNEGWGDGFCDFLRGPFKKIVGLNGDDWWHLMMKAAKDNKDGEYHYPAGQFILIAYAEYGKSYGSIDHLIDNHKAIKDFVKYLFSNFENVSLSTYIQPSPKMIKKWKSRNKI